MGGCHYNWLIVNHCLAHQQTPTHFALLVQLFVELARPFAQYDHSIESKEGAIAHIVPGLDPWLVLKELFEFMNNFLKANEITL